jgi:hypothetical protein
MMWGTTPPCAKLTGDSGSEFEATLIGDFRFSVFWWKISPNAFWDFCNTICQKRKVDPPGSR